MTRRQMTVLLGAGITVVTLTNFIPALTPQSHGHKMLFGIFIISAFLITLHLVTSILAIIIGLFTHYSRWFLLTASALFAFVAIAGFIGGDTVLGLFPINMADNLLHTIFAVTFVTTAIVFKDK